MPCQPAISSMSLGRAWLHPFRRKVDEAHKHAFQGIELFHEDLKYLAESEHGSSDHKSQLASARTIRKLCDERGLTVFALQPFNQYEGLIDRVKHAERVEECSRWIEIAHVLGSEYIGVPSTFLPADQVTGVMDVIVSDLQEIADLGAKVQPPIKFAYEALGWGTHVSTWEKSYEVVEAVDRANFGICLDTFNIAARVYADPSSPSMKTLDADMEIKTSVDRLVTTIDPAKLFYVQVVDAEKLSSPLIEGHPFHVDGQPPRMSWSRNCRLFYGEEDRGAYLPVEQICRAIFQDLEFDGWTSMELFSRTLADKHPSVPDEHGHRAAVAWEKLMRDFDLKGAPSMDPMGYANGRLSEFVKKSQADGYGHGDATACGNEGTLSGCLIENGNGSLKDYYYDK